MQLGLRLMFHLGRHAQQNLLDMSTIKTIAALGVGALLLLAGCSRNETPLEAYNAGADAVGYGYFAAPANGNAPLASSEFQGNTVKEGWLSYGVQHYEVAVLRAREHIRSYGGFVASENEVYNRYVQNTLVVRVPNVFFTDLLDSLQGLAVARDYRKLRILDYNAQVAALTRQSNYDSIVAAAYQQKLKTANTAAGVAAAEQPLRGLESSAGYRSAALHQLQNSIAFSTLTLHIRQLPANYAPPANTFWSRLWQALSNGVAGFGDVLLAMAASWPAWLLGTALAVAVFKNRKRLRGLRLRKGKTTAPAAS